jgi:hypothetical protein
LKINIWIIDDLKVNYDIVISSFPSDAKDYCDFYHFDKGMDALNLLKKALEEKDFALLPDIVFVDFYIEGDGWTGDKITKLVVELYKKYSQIKLKPYIIAFSSIGKRNEDMMKVGASESVFKMEVDGVFKEIVNNFYDRNAILSYLRPRYYQ